MRECADDDKASRAGCDAVIRTSSVDKRFPTLSSRIQNRILEEIHAGALLPGAHLEENELAARYEVSRTPVREALRQLEAIGVVKITPRRGAIVADHSADNTRRETLEVIADLEASAARYAASRMTAEERKDLIDLRQRMNRVVKDNDRVAFDKLNAEFHHRIHRSAHNSLLLEQIASMRLRIIPYTRASHMSEESQIQVSHREHEMLITALLQGDAEMAYHAMRFHVIQTGVQDEDLA
jgi:DNA-binding GntR family transcriptional regulator